MQKIQEKLQKARHSFETSRRGTLWTTRNKILAVLAVAYVVLPLDIFPEFFFPLVGWLDDFGVLTLVAWWINSHREPPPPGQTH